MLLLAAAAYAGVLRHAVVVGANDGGGSLEPLRYAELDAQRFAEVMVELGGFDPANITVLYGPGPDELEAALHAHAAVAGAAPEDLFVFYYSGHADARGLRLDSGLYPFEALKGDLRAVPADVRLGVLDACRSGVITRLKGASVTTPFLLETELATEGEAWMTATSADEEAQESDQLRGSFFTHYLLSGLRGAADGGDGSVSLAEAYNYAFDRVVDHTGGTVAGTQHPNFDYDLKGQGDMPLTAVATGRSTLTLPPEVGGMISVLRMPDRTPIAEVAKPSGRSTVLALVPGTYLLRWRPTGSRDFREALVGLNDGARLTVSRWGPVNAEVASTKGVAGVAHDALALAGRAVEPHRSWITTALNADDPRHSPAVAGTLSVVLPGAGQFYNGQWVKGGAYLTGTTLLLGTSLVALRPGESGYFHGSLTGPDLASLFGAALYGASIADAAYHPHRRETERPYTGWAVSSAAAWQADWSPTDPWVAGLTVEWMANRHFSLALERVGWNSPAPDMGAWGAGGRGAVSFLQTKRFRPTAFVAVGARYRYVFEQGGTLSPTVGAGGSFRYYVTPRYFAELEARAETDGGAPQFQYGGGIGVQLGKP